MIEKRHMRRNVVNHLVQEDIIFSVENLPDEKMSSRREVMSIWYLELNAFNI